MMTCLELKLVSQKSVNSSLATGYHPRRGEFHIPSCIHGSDEPKKMPKILVVTSIGKIFSNLTQVSRTDLLNAAAYPSCTLKAREKNGPQKFVFSCRATFHGHHNRWRVLQTFWLVTIHRMVVWINILEVTLLPSVSNGNLVIDLVLVSQ